MAESLQHRVAHRRATMKVTLFLLLLWFLVSYGCAILFRDWLDANVPSIGNAPFGFWMAQQGSIISFVCILVMNAVWMNFLDSRYGFNQKRK